MWADVERVNDIGFQIMLEEERINVSIVVWVRANIFIREVERVYGKKGNC